MDKYFLIGADFIGYCQEDKDCQQQYGPLYQCFINKNQCYQCYNSGNYHCEGEYCISDINCALGMCKNYSCTYEDSSHQFWIIVFYIFLGCVACCVCCCMVACGISCWEKIGNYLKQREINKRAKDDKSCQILLEIFEAMRRNNFFNAILFEGVSENITIIEKDCYQGKPMQDISQAIEFQAESFEQYFHHFSNQYGRYQTAYITNIYNYSGSDTILAKIIKKSYDGYKVEYFVSANFSQHKLYRMEISITPKLNYWQQREKEKFKLRRFTFPAPVNPARNTNNNNMHNNQEEERRRQEERMRGEAWMRQQEDSRRQQQEYERQQEQFRQNMRRQEEQQREYQRQQQIIAEQRLREAQQALIKQNQNRW